MSYEKKLTQIEISHLAKTYNLSDAHCHRGWDKNELRIVRKSGKIFEKVDRDKMPLVEWEYLRVFYELSKQSYSKDIKYILSSSCSMNLEMIWNYLRLNQLSLALIEPCFDNLADIFKRHRIDLSLVEEGIMTMENVEERLKKVDSDAICLVSPNNPTWLIMTEENFTKIVTFCKENSRLFIIDTCFRFYKKQEEIFDEYRILLDSWVDFIVIEDTWKTWPTHDMKVSILATSENIYPWIYDIYTDFLLHASHFVTALLTEFIKNSERDNLAHIHSVVGNNRESLEKAIAWTQLVSESKWTPSVAWLRITWKMCAIELAERLASNGVHVLPWNHFFWSDHSKWDKYIRIALTRDYDKFSEAMIILRQALSEI